MKLYPYQERVKELLFSGKSVLLQAPTGAGKTLAALAPFIEAFFTRSPAGFPRRCFYVVPMRILANQFLDEYENLAASYKRRYRQELRVTIQTGEYPKDPDFTRGDLSFCTIDQFLSSYLTIPYSLSGRKANLNAGALIGSYIVFDEFHLLDPGSSLPTALYALKQLSRIAPVLLMTATFSTEMLRMLAKAIGAQTVVVPKEEAQEIERRKAAEKIRSRTWKISQKPLDGAAVLDQHKTRSLVVCNTVRRARELHHELTNLIRERNDQSKVLLLHSQFLQADRRSIEQQLQLIFGEERDLSTAESAILVATQTIEVGLNITCERLHSELAPASSLIQRAGRCARFPGEQGIVTVYPVDTYAPYGKEGADSNHDPAWVSEMKMAYAWLKEQQGRILDFSGEQELVNTAALPRDRQVIQEITAGRVERKEAIHRVLVGDHNQETSRLLVRDIDTRRLLIHPQPDALLSNPFAVEGISISTRSLAGMVKEWLERDVEVDWRVKAIFSDRNSSGEDRNIEYYWQRVTSPSEVFHSMLVVVNPLLAGYLPDQGFLPEDGSTGFASPYPPASKYDGPDLFGDYQLETYEDHVARVLDAFYQTQLPRTAHAFRALEKAAGWVEGSLEFAAWLTCLFHDVGKLSKGWQKWVRTYQSLIEEPVSEQDAFAHTHFESENIVHREANKAAGRKSPKPTHACEGAYSVIPVVCAALKDENLICAALTAISRHHSPNAVEANDYCLEPGTGEHILNTLEFLPENMRKKIILEDLHTCYNPADPLSQWIIQPSHTYGWLAYLLLARVLRLSDQEGTRRNQQ